jgi:RNA polymerase sigma-70 factor (ECF subfamily)
MPDQKALTWAEAAAANAVSPTYGDAKTQAIINRCLAGDETAYAALYDQYASMIYRLNFSLLQNKEDAEEVLQDSFEYAFRRLHRYDASKASFKTWLYQIAVSRCRNKRRRKQLPLLRLTQIVGGDIIDTETPSADELLALNDKQKLVWGALTELSPKLRETAYLRYYEGLNYGEIGAILGIPTKTAESRMRLAHKALRNALTDSDLG